MSDILIAQEFETVFVIETTPAELVEIIAAGPQGPQGPRGPLGLQGPQGTPGPNMIGNTPIIITEPADMDTLVLSASAWRNTPQSTLTDGGNF